MTDASLARFIEHLQTDETLRRRIADAETELSATIGRETASLAQIAADVGFDITGWSNRPRTTEPTSGERASCCTSTCCLFETSVHE